MKLWPLAWRNLRREWRLPELRALGLALVLAVTALGVVATLAERVDRAVTAGAAELLGGDIGVRSDSALPAEIIQRARQLGLEVSRVVDFHSVAFANGHSQLLDVSASDPAWPLRGQLLVADANGKQRSAEPPQSGEVYLDHAAMVALGLSVGDGVQLGGQNLTVVAELVRQPDGGNLLALAPRALMHLADAENAGLLGRGARARHRLLVAGPEAATKRWFTVSAPLVPESASWITPESVQERMRSAFDRAGAFLRMAALLAALLAGVAIALAAQRYARRKTDEVAVLRALGTSWRQIAAMLGMSLLLLALPCVAIGTALALGVSQWAWFALGDLFSGPAVGIPLLPALAASAMALAVLVGFALPPLARLVRVPPIAVFRQEQVGRGRRFDTLYLVPAVVGVLLIASQSSSAQLALVLGACLVGVGLASLLLGAALLWAIRRLTANLHPSLRLGLAALARRRGLTLIQVVALSLSLTALLLLGVVAPALLDSWRSELPANTPNWFVMNLQEAQHDTFKARLEEIGAGQINMLPLAVGKLLAINDKPVGEIVFPNPQAREWAERQLRLTWSAELDHSNTVTAGRWHGAATERAEVSVAEQWREWFGLALGDRLRFGFGEKEIEATVTSFREVDWKSFQVNFFLVLDPTHAADLPHSWLTSLYLPAERASRIAALATDYPNLSLIDVGSLLDRVRSIVGRVSAAVQWVLSLSLLAGALVLVAALGASAAERRREAALLRTLGASGRQMMMTALSEFAMLGLIAGLSAAIGAFVAGWMLARKVFELADLVPPIAPLVGAALLCALLVAVIGVFSSRRILGTSPLLLLRRG